MQLTEKVNVIMDMLKNNCYVSYSKIDEEEVRKFAINFLRGIGSEDCQIVIRYNYFSEFSQMTLDETYSEILTLAHDFLFEEALKHPEATHVSLKKAFEARNKNKPYVFKAAMYDILELFAMESNLYEKTFGQTFFNWTQMVRGGFMPIGVNLTGEFIIYK